MYLCSGETGGRVRGGEMHINTPLPVQVVILTVPIVVGGYWNVKYEFTSERNQNMKAVFVVLIASLSSSVSCSNCLSHSLSLSTI